MKITTRHLLIFCSIFGVIFYLYLPSTDFGFLDGWDDPQYITENFKIHSLAFGNLVRIFTSFDMGNYAPVHILSYAIDYYFFGLDASGYRVVNIVLHFLNAVLVFVVVRRISSRDIISFFVALIFAIHPLQVETVAWVSQTKNLLSTLFMLMSFIVFIEYRSTELKTYYRASLALFVVALLSKISVVVLPAYMLAYDYLIHRKASGKGLVGDYIYFALASIAMVVITLKAQGSGVGVRTAHYGNDLGQALLVPPAIWGSYVSSLLVPEKLSALYDERVFLQSLPWNALIGAAALGVVAAMYMWSPKGKNRVLLFWGVWFFVGLLPVSQIIPMVTIMNDRYVYFPMIGFFAFIITLIVDVTSLIGIKSARTRTSILTIFFLLVAIAYGWESKARVLVWKDSCTLWSDAVSKYPNQAKAHNNLGACFENQGKLIQAEIEYRKALEIKPRLFVARYNLGKVYGQMKRYNDAITEFKIAEQVLPDDPKIHYFLGLAYKLNDQPELAIQQLQKDLIITPDDIDSIKELLDLYVRLGRYKKATSLIQQTRQRRNANKNIELFLQEMERKIERKGYKPEHRPGI